MKKKLKKVVEAALYSIDNPNISATKVSELYKVDRHILSETRKNIDTYKNNWIDGNDGYLYYFDIVSLLFHIYHIMFFGEKIPIFLMHCLNMVQLVMK